MSQKNHKMTDGKLLQISDFIIIDELSSKS